MWDCANTEIALTPLQLLANSHRVQQSRGLELSKDLNDPIRVSAAPINFDITAEHFQQLYGTKPCTFVYNSSCLRELEQFSSDAGVQVMIINVQASNATHAAGRPFP